MPFLSLYDFKREYEKTFELPHYYIGQFLRLSSRKLGLDPLTGRTFIKISSQFGIHTVDQQQGAFKQVAVQFVCKKKKNAAVHKVYGWMVSRWVQGETFRVWGKSWCQDLTAESPSTGLQYIRSLGCLLVLHHNLNPRWITWMLEQILCVFKVIIQWMLYLWSLTSGASQPWKDSPVFLHLWLCVLCLCRSTYLKTTSTISQMLRVTPSG